MMKNNYVTKLSLLVFTLLCSFLSWGQTSPAAFDLSTGSWTLTGWNSTVPASSYPGNGAIGSDNTTGVVAGVGNGNMMFWKHGSAEQGIATAESANVTTAYTAVNGRVVGNGTSGFYFDNTGGVGVGSAVLAINTTNRTSVQVAWTGRTIAVGPRQYGIRLQYRVGTSGAWTDANGTATNILYTGGAAGSSQVMPVITLPAAAENQAVVQLLWRFYYIGPTTGVRPQFGIDEINVTSNPASLNTITTNTTIAGSPFCVSGLTGASVSVPFTSTGAFTGNTYTVQLSNAAGSFVLPTNIATSLSDANSGTISATIPAGTAAGVGYRIRVISNNPTVIGTDNTVNLVVQNPANITTQPSTTVQNICQGAAVTALSVTATGTTLSYEWFSNTTATNSGGTPVGTNSASYTPVTTIAGTLYYYCVVTGACGVPATSNVSGAINVTSTPATPAGTINVSANPSCGIATLSYSAPSATTYWQTAPTNTSTSNNTLTNYPSSATAGTYTIYVRELSGSCWSPAISVTFTVVAPVAISAQPPNQVITDGSNTTFTVTATGTTPTYQWQVDTTGTGTSFVDLTNGAPYSTVTTNILNITAAPLTMNGYLYRCIVNGATPCGNVTSNSGSLTVTLTAPNNPTTIVPCYGNNTLGLSWTASSGAAPAPDGYMVFALAGGTAPASTSAAAGNSSLYTANSDFSLAATVTPSLGKCLYKGTGTSFTVTGLANLSNYSFKVVAYRGATGTAWSSGITATPTGSWAIPTTNITIDMPEVTALAASVASGQSALSWVNVTNPLVCNYEYLIVANQGSVVFTPSGNGTAYVANTIYSGPNQVVYKGTGTGITVTGLTNGTNYCYKVFVRRGTEWSDGVSVCQTPNLVYCASGATSNLDSEIENVTLVGYSTTISNNTANACTTGVNNYTALSADLQVAGTYTVSVEFGDCNGGAQYDGAGGVWIDWNNDGDFLDANETIGTALVAVSGGNVTQNFTINVPLGQPIGNYRMRIVQTESATLAMLNPCGTFNYGSTEDYTVQVINACVPTHTVTTFTPTSGPAGTEVTINGTGLTGTTVTFSGVTATVVSNTGTQMVVIVPATATTGILSVKDSQPCTIDNSFTVVKNNTTTCEGIVASTTDLIIYDIHDEKDFDGGFITLYNGTAATVNLVNYRLYRTSNYGDTNYIDYANLTGSIAPGALGILKVSVGSCGPASTNGTINGGFNQNDGIQLRDAAGVVIIDDVHTYIPSAGYYMVRNTGALSARTSYVASDWSTIPLASGVCYPSAGLVLPIGTAVAPVVTTHPTYSPSCGSTSAVLNTAGTEGFAGGNTLAYQWYFAAPGSAIWTSVTDGGIYSGVTTTSLTISNTTTVINYQYYCQIRENTATCYSATNAIKITDTNASTWNGITWIGGTPTITKAAIIDGTYVTATNGNFSCCSLTVNSGVGRSLTISSGGYVEVQNDITNNGILDVLSDGSLVQISDVAVNTGNISYNRTANIRRQDYVYWSSPVAGFNNTAISPTTSTGFQYKWLPTTGGLNNFGNWTYANETMVLGKGYIVRGPSAFSLTALANYTATFTGVPNNGVVTIPISRGDYDGVNYNTGVSTTLGTKDDDNWNLVGNPYPSAIHAVNFLALNTNIAGFVNIWTHGTLPSSAIADPFYNNFVYNYTPGDYISYNAAGASSGPGMFNGRIAGGQGFFVSMLHTSAAATENLIFNNSLRNISYNNGQFFKSNLVNKNEEELEKHRIWFDLVSSSGASTRSLLGYIEEATNGKDRLFDAFTNEKLSFNVFSLIDNEQMLIQGRALPFDNNDQVNIGVSIPQDGLYKIAISALDGLFSNTNQNIYLEDKVLNVIYDLRTSPYSFMANKGIIKDRFVIRYNNGVVLANETFEANNDVVLVSNQELSVLSRNEKITNIIVFDVLGRKLLEAKNIKTNDFILPISKRNAPLFIEIGLENGIRINKKTVY